MAKKKSSKKSSNLLHSVLSPDLVIILTADKNIVTNATNPIESEVANVDITKTAKIESKIKVSKLRKITLFSYKYFNFSWVKTKIALNISNPYRLY